MGTPKKQKNQSFTNWYAEQKKSPGSEYHNNIQKAYEDYAKLSESGSGGKKDTRSYKEKKQSEEFGQGGQRFAESIIGEGFSRLGEDEEIQAALAYKKASADELGEAARMWEKVAEEGYGTQEMEALKAQQQRQMSKEQQSMGYRLGAKSGGGKGASSIAQTRSLFAAGNIGRATLEQKLFTESEDIKREGIAGLVTGLTAYSAAIDTYGEALGSVKEFDIGLEKTEKDIRLQAGLGFEEMKQSEINAKIQAEAAVAAARATRSCFLPQTLIIMEDGSEKQIKDIDPGDYIKAGGYVSAIGLGKATEFYYWKGVPVAQGHCVKDKWGWVPVELATDVRRLYFDGPDERYVVNVVCANHELRVKGSEARYGDWLDAEDKSYWSKLYVPYKKVKKLFSSLLSKLLDKQKKQSVTQTDSKEKQSAVQAG